MRRFSVRNMTARIMISTGRPEGGRPHYNACVQLNTRGPIRHATKARSTFCAGGTSPSRAAGAALYLAGRKLRSRGLAPRG